jgi:SCY1-like protein 1
MNFLKTLGIVSGNSTGGLPYSIDSNEKGNSSSSSDANFDQHCLSDFYLFNGKSKQDSSRHVSIFKSKQPANAITQNALKRYKTLRHPNVLSFLDGIEMPNHGSIIIVTEQVVPLPEYLSTLHRQYAKSGGINSPEFQMSIAWGLRSILLALKFINCDCKLFHGRLDPKSIFVTKVCPPNHTL